MLKIKLHAQDTLTGQESQILFYGTNAILCFSLRGQESSVQLLNLPEFGINRMILTLPEFTWLAYKLSQAEDACGLSMSHAVAEGHTQIPLAAMRTSLLLPEAQV